MTRERAGDGRMFPGLLDEWILPGIGHNVPQEAPEAFAEAVLAVSP